MSLMMHKHIYFPEDAGGRVYRKTGSTQWVEWHKWNGKHRYGNQA